MDRERNHPAELTRNHQDAELSKQVALWLASRYREFARLNVRAENGLVALPGSVRSYDLKQAASNQGRRGRVSPVLWMSYVLTRASAILHA